MKRYILYGLGLFILGNHTYSQTIHSSSEYKVSFETSEILTPYETESDSVLGLENDNYAVDIEVLQIDEYYDELNNNAKL
jgi:hypothetical protein